MVDVEGFGSEDTGSPEPAGFVVDGAWDWEDEELVVGGFGAIWVSNDGPGGFAG